jgi:xylan 1,4-beta-xylosidase
MRQSLRVSSLLHCRTTSVLLFLLFWAATLPLASPLWAQVAAPDGKDVAETISIDAKGATTPFPHFWEQMFGSGRAALALRDSYRRDLREVRAITGFQYVRFHAIFHDELGVYDEDAQGRPVYNWSYVDQIYDGLLDNGVKPFIELSFMPKKMASRQDLHAFWYKQVVAPPKSYDQWGALVEAFTRHLVERYGIDEVAQWYFEVWNEPNIDFWTGRPAQSTYFELYDHAARAVKAVNPRLRVGGPATAQAAWVDAMIAHATENHVPLDFVSTHVYGNDTAKDVFGHDLQANQQLEPHGMVCAAVARVHQQIKASAHPELPLIWSEFNATYMNQPEITDSIYMGPWMAGTIAKCDGLVNMMSYWTFSDVFEEQGVVKTPFYGGYGLIAEDDIPKPAFDAFALLHGLGTQRIANSAEDVLVTKADDGSLVIALWNREEPKQTTPAKDIELKFSSIASAAIASVERVDAQHGDTYAEWQKMGSPRYPTKEQVAALRSVAKLPPAEQLQVTAGRLALTVPPNGLAIVTVK